MLLRLIDYLYREYIRLTKEKCECGIKMYRIEAEEYGMCYMCHKYAGDA